ncbi:ATP-binding protein [Paenibacillus nasutitermitis]|uniref:Circadian input-output histidine kinase CikA n=1 Tax=Paenibacillus nasutitermitis TaxID=1652958 RepID=A0A917DY84_9BACL|nr:ATP-binding protein [Paenibacillus nasutitermitis]GGD78080.1 histidine kinase [Paenibacillus nasutitermitis]
MKFRTKLFGGFAAVLLLLLIFSYLVLRTFFMMNRNMHGIVDDNYSKVKLANIIQEEINSLNTETTELLLDVNSDRANERSANIEALKFSLDTNLNALDQMFEDQPDASILAQELHQLTDLYVESNDAAIKLLLNKKKDQAIQLHNRDTGPIRLKLFLGLKAFSTLQEKGMDQSLMNSTRTYSFAIRLVVVLLVMTLIAGIFVAIWVLRSVIKSLGYIVAVMKEAAMSANNDLLPRIEVATKDEMASIGHAYNIMAEALEDHARYQQQANLLLQEQNWNKTMVAEITAIYQGIQNLNELAGRFMSALTPALGASYGVVYHRKEIEGGSTRFVKIGAYAPAAKDIGADSFGLGEGLAGQCAAENKRIVLTGPPNEYIHISSALGTAPPRQIVIVPVPYESSVVAVIELASFHPFTPAHLQLLEDLAGLLGITVNSVSGHMQIQQLLHESQTFTEELQTQSEELQLQQEELKTLNDQLGEQIKASEQKTIELEHIKDVLEDKNKHIMLASGYKSEFLANMSHELRTPLNSLLILSQLLAKNTEGNLNLKQVEYSQTIFSSGKNLLGLINEILDLSKIESGKLEVNFAWVQLSNIVDFIERQYEPVASDKDLQFHISLDEDIAGIMIYTDGQRLQQILQNLLSNAFKFTEQGSVTMRFCMTSKEEINEPLADLLTDYALAISVQDTGIGIPKDKHAVIFEAFRQADGTTSRKYGGTGLGLSICQQMAQLLNGFIRIESEEGIGSTFTLYIPTGKVPSELSAPYENEAAAALVINNDNSNERFKEQMVPSLEGKKILIVDDDLRNIYALTTALEAHQIRIIFAENGQEGIHLLHQNTDTDLILMDIMMPTMDGHEAIREIRKIDSFKTLPIIALSAKAMKYDRDKCMEAGANDYISKPVLLDQLLSLIQVWLYRQES